jgi:hypothetical protein
MYDIEAVLTNHFGHVFKVPPFYGMLARVAGGSGVRPVSIREFTIVTDSAPALAGYNLGPTAPELLLASLASCLAHTYLIVAANRGVTVLLVKGRSYAQPDPRAFADAILRRE